MDADIQHGVGLEGRGAPLILPLVGLPQPDLVAVMAAFTQQTQVMMQMMQAFQQQMAGAGANPGGVQSVPGGLSGHLASDRLDERAFRRLEKVHEQTCRLA